MEERSTLNEIFVETHIDYSPDDWNKLVAKFSNSSILQSYQWGSNKSKYGWSPRYLVWKDHLSVRAAALVLIREYRLHLFRIFSRIAYIPHGPLLDWGNHTLVDVVLDDLIKFAKDKKVDFLKIDPTVILGTGMENSLDNSKNNQALKIIESLQKKGWVISTQQIQFKNTFLVNLESSEDELLSKMKQKTRYNIRLANKKGIRVRTLGIDELHVLYEMYAITSARDGFIIRPREYYLELWKYFIKVGLSTALIAEYNNEPVAGLVLFHFHDKSYYFYGMSTENHREKMPNHLLQWEAMKISKAKGCKVYDLWGAPNILNNTDPMWGVHKFKEGFGAQLIKMIGAYDYPSSVFKYKIIQNILPKILSITRFFRRRQIRLDADL